MSWLRRCLDLANLSLMDALCQRKLIVTLLCLFARPWMETSSVLNVLVAQDMFIETVNGLALTPCWMKLLRI
jgi:hypothetical protein